jgi:cyclopropane fatty-acyl-phospholipid synthase-like methyltransferase
MGAVCGGLAIAASMPAASAGAQQARRPTPDIHFVPTSPAIVDAMLKVARVTPADVIYDLGSGDGRIVITAAQKYGARGVGIEIDPELIKEATKRASKAGVAGHVAFLQADLFKADLSEASVVTLFLSASINRRLEAKLKRELAPGARVVSHRFQIDDWKPDEDLEVNGTHVYLWHIPPR